MPSQISNLTDQQYKKLIEIRKKWEAIGFSTDKLDKKAVKETLVQFYKTSNFDLDETQIFFVKSPMALLLANLLKSQNLKKHKPLNEELIYPIPESVSIEISEILSPTVITEIRKAIGESHTFNNFFDSLEFVRRVLSERAAAYYKDFQTNLKKIQDKDVESIISVLNSTSFSDFPQFAQRDRQERAQQNTENQKISEILESTNFGQQNAEPLALYDFFLNELNLSQLSPMIPFLNSAESCGWFTPYESYVLVSEKPTIFKRDAQFRMHNADGPAIAFSDGYSIYAFHNVIVPKYVIEQPTTITIKDIESERNAEVRRVKMERYGISRYLIDSNAKKVQSDEFGILYSKDVTDDEPIQMVKVINSTPEAGGHRAEYFLRVPPTVATAKEGVSWTFDKQAIEYAPMVET